MRTALAIIIAIHGLIHLFGFAKAFQVADLKQLQKPISKPMGMIWLAVAFLFLAAACMLIVRSASWWMPGAIAVILSQYLLIQSWSDAKYGSILNFVILLPLAMSFMGSLPSSYFNRFREEAIARLAVNPAETIMTEADITQLPVPVQSYLRYTGSIGKPKIYNFRVVFEGKMRQKLDAAWMAIFSQQYDFINEPARLFYIKSKMFGIPFDGYHRYIGPNATMEIKVASLLKVVDAKGKQMDQGETVTLFNDMCLLAPATLIGKNIKWETADSLTVRARFTNQGNTITALLFFNSKGEMVNFSSEDRYLTEDGITYYNYKWSTPVKDYKDFNGWKIASYGEAVWETPQGPFCYAKFDIKAVEYNCRHFVE